MTNTLLKKPQDPGANAEELYGHRGGGSQKLKLKHGSQSDIASDIFKIKIRAIWLTLKKEPLYFWGICFYLFVEYVRPTSIYKSLSFIPMGEIAVLGTFFLFFLARDRKWLPNTANILMVLFLLTFYICSYLAYDPAIAFENQIDFVLWFLVFFLITQIVNTEVRFFIFLLSFLLYTFKMSQHGLLVWAGQGFQFLKDGINGAPGWFHNSGEFGIQLCIFFPISIYFIHALQKNWSKLVKFFFYLMPLTAAACIVGTSSRGALVGLAASCLWMLFQTKYKIKGLVLIIILAIPVIFLIPQESLNRLEASGKDDTSQERLERWEAGIDMMKENPVFGVGHANYQVIFPAYYIRDGKSYLSHNIFIQVGSELGLAGLILFLMMIYCSLSNTRKARDYAKSVNNRFLFYTGHGLDAALIGYLVSGSFITVFYYPYFWINFALSISLFNAAQALYNSQAKPPNQHPLLSKDSP